VRAISRWMTQFFRNAPWLVLLFFCVLLLPHRIEFWGMAVDFPPWVKGILGLTLPVMGNVSEVVRGGILSLPAGQWEAANALAFNRRQTLSRIILPQAIKRMLPPWMNVYAVLMMATPLVSIVGVNDSVTVARAVLAAENNHALLMPVYGLVLVLFLLLSLMASAALGALQNYGGELWTHTTVMQASAYLSRFFSFAIVVALFAVVFKLLPDSDAPWLHVIPGAMVTTGLFSLGKWGIGFYLSHSSIASAYGVTGSVVVLLLWIYYSSLMFFLGAVLTRQYVLQVAQDS